VSAGVAAGFSHLKNGTIVLANKESEYLRLFYICIRGWERNSEMMLLSG
jgi:hypothetical protein